MTVTFACGHQVTWDGGEAPRCATCGERRIAHTNAPPPRITGTCESPLKVTP